MHNGVVASECDRKRRAGCAVAGLTLTRKRCPPPPSCPPSESLLQSSPWRGAGGFWGSAGCEGRGLLLMPSTQWVDCWYDLWQNKKQKPEKEINRVEGDTWVPGSQEPVRAILGVPELHGDLSRHLFSSSANSRVLRDPWRSPMCTGCFGAVPSLGSEKFWGMAARTERLPSHDRLHAWRPGFRDLPLLPASGKEWLWEDSGRAVD